MMANWTFERVTAGVFTKPSAEDMRIRFTFSIFWVRNHKLVLRGVLSHLLFQYFALSHTTQDFEMRDGESAGSD